MTDRETHQMRLERTYESGAEEWLCPSCGRKFVMQWPPRYKRIVLHEGDQNAAHTGGKGGLHMGRLDVRPDEPPAPEAAISSVADDDLPDPTDAPIADELRPWMRWLSDIGFDE